MLDTRTKDTAGDKLDDSSTTDYGDSSNTETSATIADNNSPMVTIFRFLTRTVYSFGLIAHPCASRNLTMVTIHAIKDTTMLFMCL